MTETQFIEENKSSWEELEKLLESKTHDPDRLQTLFTKVSGDLAYATTFFPNRSVRVYLNMLTQRVFDSMSTKKAQFSLQSIKNFFITTLPLELYRSRKALLISLAFFSTMMIIGAVSTAYHEDFASIILGDGYIAMTEENIANGDPMAVYKDRYKTDMFLAITVNNVRVSFMTYILGIFGSLGTIIILMYNGIMVGTFQYFFYQKGLFLTSFLTIWIHGTIEISAIVIAGAAGLILGSGLLFPKTYSRLVSLQVSAIRSLKILISTIPLFVIAGFLEGFVTRHTEFPDVLQWFIILASLSFILFIYWIYPQRVASKLDLSPDYYDTDRLPPKRELKAISNHNFLSIFILATSGFSAFVSNYFRSLLMPLILVSGGAVYCLIRFVAGEDLDEWTFVFDLILLISAIYYTFRIVTAIYKNERYEEVLNTANPRLLFVISAIVCLVFFGLISIPQSWELLVFLLLPASAVFALLFNIGDRPDLISHFTALRKHYAYYARTLLMTIVLIGLFALLQLVFSNSLFHFFMQFLTLHDGLSNTTQSAAFFEALFTLITYLIALPYFIYLVLYMTIALRCYGDGYDIDLQLKTFGDNAK